MARDNALEEEWRAIPADLVPYANNARTHTPEQVKQIASSSEKITPPGLRKLRALRRADRDWGERTGVFGTSGATSASIPRIPGAGLA